MTQQRQIKKHGNNETDRLTRVSVSVIIQCRNSSTTDWDFSGPSLRRKVDPGKKVTLFNLIASVYIRKKLTSWLEPRADNSARACSDSATAFLSDGRQPDAVFLHRWVVVWLKLLGESSL